MKLFKKEYKKEEGFLGEYKAFRVSCHEELFFHWLQKETIEAENIYDKIKEIGANILVIEKIHVKQEYRLNGFGKKIINDLLEESQSTIAILVCNVLENQKMGFNLEKFYEVNDFKTIMMNNDYPLMLYPKEIADNILTSIN